MKLLSTCQQNCCLTMTLDRFHQIISDKEVELAKIKQAAADAALQEEEKAKEHLLQTLKYMELELEKARQESDYAIQDAVRRVQSEATARIDCAENEMGQKLRQVEKETLKVAYREMEKTWVLREETLRAEFQLMLSSELEHQCNTLASHYESIIQKKDEAMKGQDDIMRRQVLEIEGRHKSQLDGMSQKVQELAEEIWKNAIEKVSVAAEEELSNKLEIATKQCRSKDDQIAMLLEERSMLQKLVDEKELLLEDSVSNMKKMEVAFKEIASEFNAHHETQMAHLSEEAMALMRDNEKIFNAFRSLELENSSIKEDLVRLGFKCKALEKKCSDQKDMLLSASVRDNNKCKSRVYETSTCKQLLETQLMDLKSENKDLLINLEKRNNRIHELTSENEKKALKASNLSIALEDLRQKNHKLKNECATLEKKCADTMEYMDSFRKDRRVYEKEMESRLKEKDALLAEALSNQKQALETVKYRLNLRSEPVFVHLYGNSCDNGNVNALKGSQYSQNERDIDISTVEKVKIKSP